jgi:hypothetical protein
MKEFKIRASAIGKIMTAPRSKSETLSETAKGYLREWYISEKYGRTKEIRSKFLTKGNEAEEKSITLLNEYFLKNGKRILLKKNDEHHENEHMTGTPDLLPLDEVFDVKSSWDLFTFPFFDTECTNKMYWWQLQGYMHLTGREKASICYCLTDTPEALIFDECRRISYERGLGGEIPDDLEAEVRKNHIFDDIPLEDRIRIFQVKRDDSAIAQIREKVEECRNFLSQF